MAHLTGKPSDPGPCRKRRGGRFAYATQSSVAVAQAARLLHADVRARRPERSYDVVSAGACCAMRSCICRVRCGTRPIMR